MCEIQHGIKSMLRHRAVEKFAAIFTCTVFLFTVLAYAGELEESRKELAAIQARIAEEEARYQAARAAMERSQIVAQYVFPDLRAREKQLSEKIEILTIEEA